MTDEHITDLDHDPDEPAVPDGVAGGFECDVCGEQFWHDSASAHVARGAAESHIMDHYRAGEGDIDGSRTTGSYLTDIDADE